MVVLLIVLIATNVATLAALAWARLRPADQPGPDRRLAASLDAAATLTASTVPGLSSSSERRVITIEILNPIELAATRGRIAGLAGSLAPGLTRRLVYDQAMRTVRRNLADEQVVADVRLHLVAPLTPIRIEPPQP